MALLTRKCECSSKGVCHCFQTAVDREIWQLNVGDVAESIVEILIMCRILRSKAKRALKVITDTFYKFDQERSRVDVIPVKKMHKTMLIHALSTKCKMDRFDVQISYSIIRRAFRAFFYATDDYGLPDREIESQLKHSRECLWVHAAERTAQVYAIYESLDYNKQKKFETKLKCIYKNLHDRVEARYVRLEAHNQRKKSCALNKKTGGLSASNSFRDLTLLKPSESVLIEIPKTLRCSCTKLDCVCEPVWDDESSVPDLRKGPYECRWVPILDADQPAVEIVLPPDIVCTPSVTEEECATEEFCICEECDCVCEDSSVSEILTASEGEEEQESQIDNCGSLKDIIGEPQYPEVKITEMVQALVSPQALHETVHEPTKSIAIPANEVQNVEPIHNISDSKFEIESNRSSDKVETISETSEAIQNITEDKKVEQIEEPLKSKTNKLKSVHKIEDAQSAIMEQVKSLSIEQLPIQIKKKKLTKKNLPCCPKCIPRKSKSRIRELPPTEILSDYMSSDEASCYPDHSKYKT